MKEIKRTALIGLGALGILYGRKMADQGGLTVIAGEERIARYRQEQTLCNGEPCGFHYAPPSQGEPVDFLLVAVKATALDGAIADMAPFVGPETVILSVLNGITSEERLNAVWPGQVLWSVAVGMDATRTGRSLVYQRFGVLQFGERNGEMTQRVRLVGDYLDACGIVNQPCQDILYKQWLKLMINDGVNQTAAAFGLNYGGLSRPGMAREKMLQAMQEVIHLANLEGVPLPPDADVAWLDANLPTFHPEGMPSMRQDILAGRKTEVEEFAGLICRLGEKHHMPTPANDFFYQTIRKLESRSG